MIRVTVSSEPGTSAVVYSLSEPLEELVKMGYMTIGPGPSLLIWSQKRLEEIQEKHRQLSDISRKYTRILFTHLECISVLNETSFAVRAGSRLTGILDNEAELVLVRSGPEELKLISESDYQFHDTLE